MYIWEDTIDLENRCGGEIYVRFPKDVTVVYHKILVLQIPYV